MSREVQPQRSFENLIATVFIPAAVLLALLGAFGAGAGFHYAYSQRSDDEVVKELWKQVDKYQSHLKDPGNLERDAALGLNFVRPPFDLNPVLAELVSRGELRHYDIVLPDVPRGSKFDRHWMVFCDTHPEFVEATSSVPSFRISGRQPIALDLWVKKDHEALVQQLIDELETMAAQEPAGM